MGTQRTAVSKYLKGRGIKNEIVVKVGPLIEDLNPRLQ